MTITRVQGSARGTSSTDSIGVSMASTPTQGNLLIATILVYYYVVVSISQTGVTWTKQVSKQQTSLYQTDVEIWAGIVGSGANKDLTISLTPNANGGAIADVCEYSGLLTSGFLDKTAIASGTYTRTQVTGTTATTTQSNELWIGAIANTQDKAPNELSSPANGFTLLDGASYGGGPIHAHAYLERIVSDVGKASSGTTSTVYTKYEAYAGCIATFKASGITYSPKTRSSLPNTMMTMLNNKMLFSACNRFPKLNLRRI